MSDEMLAVIARGGGWVSMSEVGARGHSATTVAKMAREILRLRDAARASLAECPLGCTADCYCGRCEPLLDTLLDTGEGQWRSQGNRSGVDGT